jgi:hypothetical protein
MSLSDLLTIIEDDKQTIVASPYGDKIFYDGKKEYVETICKPYLDYEVIHTQIVVVSSCYGLDNMLRILSDKCSNITLEELVRPQIIIYITKEEN